MPVSAIFENIEAGINHQMPSSNVLTKEHSMNADEKRSGGTKMTQCGWSEVGHDGGGVGGAKQVDAGVGVARGAERFRLAARVIGWAVGLWLFYFPGFVCGEAASPTPVTSAATANPTPEGKISLEATARKRVPNKVADVVLAVQVDGRAGDAVSSALSQRSQTLLDYLRQQAVDQLTTEEVGFEPQVEPVRGGPDRIVGYTGHASVSFRTTPDKLGTLLSGSLEHGANTITQTQFTPLESDIDAARRDLAIEATKTALARADAVAQAAGVRVVRIEDITVRSEESVVPLQFKSARAMEAPAPARAIETATGEQEISVRVLVQVRTCK